MQILTLIEKKGKNTNDHGDESNSGTAAKAATTNSRRSRRKGDSKAAEARQGGTPRTD